MANDYFNASTTLTKHTLARSAQVNSIFQSVAAGLDKLPDADPLNQGRVTYVADTGSADAYVVALSKVPSSYVAGLSIVMKATNANTGASTVNVNSLGVKTIKRYDGIDLVAGDILAGALIHLVYDGTNFRIVGANGAESALAKEWATKTGSTVDGTGYSAKAHAESSGLIAEGSSKEWASKTGGAVASSEHSAKSWAQETGGNAPTAGSAKEWATVTGVVDGGLKGAKGYAEDASTSASAAATSEANAESHFDTFQGIFYGALSADPANDPNGDPPAAGDWYFNTSSNNARQYNGATWDDIGAAKLATFVFTATGGETSLSGDDDDGNTLAYTVDFIQAHLNGVLLTPTDDYTATNGTSITGLSALTAGDVVVIDAFSKFALSDALLESDLSDNEVLAKVGSADPTGLPVSTNSLVGRLGGNLTTLSVAASRIVGRAASGAMKAMTAQEVRDVIAKPASQQIFTAGGTWNRPAGCKYVRVQVQGPGTAGNAAGSGQVSGSGWAGPGGAAGGYTEKWIDVSAIASATVTVGTGGVSGSPAASGPSSWSDGVNTLTGGNPGVTVYSPAGNDAEIYKGDAGGNASGGDINIPGRAGDTGWAISEIGSSTMAVAHAGKGADSILGSGGRGGVCVVASGDDIDGGESARGYGAGGGGAAIVGNVTVAAGDGSDGVVIVTEYYA